jgi:hypothetical protein
MKSEGLSFPEACARVAAEAGTSPAPGNGNGKHQGDVWQPMMPPPADAPKPTGAQLRCDMLHEYHDPADLLLCYVRRHEAKGSQRKQFYPLTYGTLNGKTGWHDKAPDAPRPLYGLNRLSHAAPDAAVLLVEGEKAADAAQRLFADYVAMSWMGGANADGNADLSPLQDRTVIIWPDADAPGRAVATHIAKRLSLARILDTTGLPDGFDAADLERDGVDDPDAWLSKRLPKQREAEPTEAIQGELLVAEPADTEDAIPPRDYVVPGHIQRGVVTELIGPGSAGKSQLCIAWVVALALGHEFGDFRPTRAMRVLVFNVEDDIAEQQRRVAAALRLFGATKAGLGGRLLLVTPTRTGMLLSADPDTRALQHTTLMIELLEQVEALKPDLLILDPLVELHDAEENDNTLGRHVLAEFRVIARQHNIGLLLCHHVRKSNNPEPGNADAGRGASAVGAAVRKCFTIFPMSDAEAERWQIRQPQFYFRLDGAKANHDRKNGTEWFERVVFTLDNGDAVAAASPWTPPAEAITDKVVGELIELVEEGHHGKPFSPQIGSYDRSISVAMCRVGISARKAQRNALDAILAAGCTEAAWKTSSRRPARGLRGPGGGPAVHWMD